MSLHHHQPQIFGSGLELASCVAASDLLRRSWAAVSSLYEEVKADSPATLFPRFKIYRQSERETAAAPVVLAFVTWPVFCPAHLRQEEVGGGAELISSEDLKRQRFPQFEFLCSKANPSFSFHNAAIGYFASLFDDQLVPLASQLLVTKPNETTLKSPLIVTGHALGGSIAALFTLWLLDRMSSKKPAKNLPLCITYGSPLVGDEGLHRAISQRSTWNSCFLHVISSRDPLPSALLAAKPSKGSSYHPFGNFLMSDERRSGEYCVGDADMVSLLLSHKAAAAGGVLEGDFGVDGYGEMVECLGSRVFWRGSSVLGGFMADSVKAGIALLLQSVGVSPDQSTMQLATELEKKQKFTTLRRRSATEQSRKVQEIKIKMAYLEWYKKDSRNRGTGYYDSYKTQSTIADMEIAKHKKFLTNYWKDLVEEAESKPQKESSFFRTTFLYGGTNYRRMVEPLDVAEFYRDGRNRGYRKQGRSEHYALLEKWLNDDAAGKKKDKKEKRAPGDNMNEDSCFWAEVEEALFCVRLVKNGGGENGEAKSCLVEFQRYVMEQIESHGLDSEVFLEGSSFMVWWKEFQEVAGVVNGGGSSSSSSSLVEFMKSGRYRGYGAASES